MKFEDMNGRTYSRLKVLRRGVTRNGKDTQWVCECQCGTIKSFYARYLKSGTSTSCGCARTEALNARSYKHGCAGRGKRAPEYSVWKGVVNRTTNTSDARYADYGGRGILICDEWRHSFPSFMRDMGARPTPKHSIDRVDNSKGYTPENCRWATATEQGRNTRKNRMITYQGETKCLSEWAEITGLRSEIISHRLSSPNYTMEQAMTTPIGGKPR